MRVEPAEGPLDLQPGDHHAVRSSTCAQLASTRATLATVVIVNPCSHRLTVRAVGTTWTSPKRQRVILDEGEMPQPPAAHEQQPHAPHRPEVTPGHPGHGVADRH